MAILFVEQLTVIDCAYLDAQRGLVGESWIVDLELEGDLDDQSMVLDFGEVKKKLKRVIDGRADHKLIIPMKSASLDLERSKNGVGLFFRAIGAAIEHHSPASAICTVDAAQVDANTLTLRLLPAVERAVPKNVAAVRIMLRNEETRGAYYHYVHGLKKHAGHCQRIAHGHRSHLEIYVGGVRAQKREKAWAAGWRDVYLATAADLASRRGGRLRFEYKSSEGRFELELPEERCELLSVDTTVERIADHIAGKVAHEWPGKEIEVRAYEGVMKGAVARRKIG